MKKIIIYIKRYLSKKTGYKSTILYIILNFLNLQIFVNKFEGLL